MGQEFIMLLSILPLGILQHRSDLGIGKPSVGKHYGRIKTISTEIAMGVDVHLTHHA
jgi:hypothetical protein